MQIIPTLLDCRILFLIYAALISLTATASNKECARAVWNHGNRGVFSVQSIAFSNSGLRIEKMENQLLGELENNPTVAEPSWISASREANQERALSLYVRRGWPESFIQSLREVGPKVAPYSRWANLEDSSGEQVAGIALVASEMLCIHRHTDGSHRCSGAWSDFDLILTDPAAWDRLQPVSPLALEILHEGLSVPRIPHREYVIGGHSFSFSRVYEIRHYFLNHRHPLAAEARGELTFAVLEWMFRDFSNDGDDMFRWPPPGVDTPCVFSYGDQKSITLYSPLSLEVSHDWSNGRLNNWAPLSATPLEMIESIFFWPSGDKENTLQSKESKRRLKTLREKYFPPEKHFTSAVGVVLRSDIFEVKAEVLRQSGRLPNSGQ